MAPQYRPQKRFGDIDFQIFTVPTGQTVRAGMGVKLNATDAGAGDANYPEAQEAAADTDVIYAIAFSEDPSVSWTAGEQFHGILLGEGATVPIRVGTGGITRGSHVVATSDGFTNAPAHGTGSRIYSPGVAIETNSTAGNFASIELQKVALSKA